MTVASIGVAAPFAPETTAEPFISIVMPCLNEEETVGVCVAKAKAWLERSGRQGEVLVVDNGSTDRSVELAEAAGARVIHERRRGYGQAYLRGFSEAKGEWIVMGDSDDTYDFSDLTAVVEPLRRGVDMVIGNRFTGGIAKGAMPWSHRYIGSPIINLVIRLFFGTQIGDSQSGLRAFRKEVPQELNLRSGGMELASEMIVRAARAGLNIAEVPAPYNVRGGESKLNTVRDGWRHIRYLLVAAPDFLFVLPGLATTLLGIAAFALSFAAPQGIGIGSLSWHPIFIGSILLAVGVNSMLLGIIAKTHACARGLIRPDAWLMLYRRYFRLEHLLALSVVLVLGGLAIDVALFGIWASNGTVAKGLELAALAQSLLIVGAELGMTSFLVVAVDSE